MRRTVVKIDMSNYDQVYGKKSLGSQIKCVLQGKTYEECIGNRIEEAKGLGKALNGGSKGKKTLKRYNAKGGQYNELWKIVQRSLGRGTAFHHGTFDDVRKNMENHEKNIRDFFARNPELNNDDQPIYEILSISLFHLL